MSRNLDSIGTVYVTPQGDIYRLDEAEYSDLMEEWRERYTVMIAKRGFTTAYALPDDAEVIWKPREDTSHLLSPDGTTPERVRYLKATNHRLRVFLNAAERNYWKIEPSGAAPDCVIVRHPRFDDHFVLYPSGSGRTASVSVYDGRQGHEFNPIPARTARAWMYDNGRG